MTEAMALKIACPVEISDNQAVAMSTDLNRLGFELRRNTHVRERAARKIERMQSDWRIRISANRKLLEQKYVCDHSHKCGEPSCVEAHHHKYQDGNCDCNEFFCDTVNEIVMCVRVEEVVTA